VDGDTLTVTYPTVVPAEGCVDIVNNEIKFTPAMSFAGDDTLSYTIDDGNGGTDMATFTVTAGTAGDDQIGGGYLDDPEGDRVANNDAIIGYAGFNDDIIYGFGGDEVPDGGTGSDLFVGGNKGRTATTQTGTFWVCVIGSTGAVGGPILWCIQIKLRAVAL